MRIGLDFGTTNSGAATFDGQRMHRFALDPSGHDPTVMRSTLYITRDHQVFLGQEAVDTYYRQNIGRPSKIVRQYVGEIEMTVGEVGAVKGYPVELQTFVRDVYVLIDELTPGRLFRSLKSGLAAADRGTTVFGRHYELEDLLALYLQGIRERVEAESGHAVDSVVLGRPVSFVGSAGQAEDQLAEGRLRQAAERAGFRDISFELEPVAAALHYEQTVDRPQDIVVFDFGGGTLDITVMHVGEPGRRAVFATGGLDIAGDVFDQRIIEGVMLDHFGRGSTWGEDAAPFPGLYTDALVNWQTISELNRPETLHFLEVAQLTGSHPARVRALESLLVNNYAIRLIDEVERGKIALSTDHLTLVRLAGDDLNVWQPITRLQFVGLIAAEILRVESCLLDTVDRSGLQAAQVDAVVRTGGSAQIPCFVQMMDRLFGPDKVVSSDTFGSVTSGLAIRAHLDHL